LLDWGLAAEQVDRILAHPRGAEMIKSIRELDTVRRGGSDERWREELGQLFAAQIAPILREAESDDGRPARSRSRETRQEPQS
jgi:hypothetical protein